MQLLNCQFAAQTLHAATAIVGDYGTNDHLICAKLCVSTSVGLRMFLSDCMIRQTINSANARCVRHRWISDGVAFSECLQRSRPIYNAVSMWWAPYGFLMMLWVGESCVSSNPAHCWNSNAHCNGSISHSFRRESDCCKFGGMSYIKCSTPQQQQAILMMKVRTQFCVPCPPKPVTTTVKPNAKCTPSTCPKLNERCMELVNTKTTFCFKCDRQNCDKYYPVCGSDKKTYKDECTLLCRSPPNTLVAYQGHCKVNATCSIIKCKKGFECFTKKGKPRCCIIKIVCGSNKVTYASINDLNQDICRKGKLITINHRGRCKPWDNPKVVSPCSNLVLPFFGK